MPSGNSLQASAGPYNSRMDPLGAFQFAVEIDGLIVGGFSEVSGIQAETKVYTYREGGENGFTHSFADSTSHSRLVLKRGMTFDGTLWEWYREVLNGAFTRRSVYVLLIGNDGETAWMWIFTNAFPVKWTGPELRAAQNEIAVETLEIVYQEALTGVRPW